MITYYLFGTDVCRIYNDNAHLETDELCLLLATELSKNNGDMFAYNPDINHPSNLLLEFNGWMEFIEIEKEEYERTRKFITCPQQVFG